MNRMSIPKLGYGAVAILVWSTACVAATLALIAFEPAADQTKYLLPVIASAGLILIGCVMFSLRNVAVPPRHEVVVWLMLLVMATYLLATGLIYRLIWL